MCRYLLSICIFFAKICAESELKYVNQGVVAVEMESFALFYLAKLLNKKAACILTISDNLVTKEETTSMERQKSFKEMILLALESAIKL